MENSTSENKQTIIIKSQKSAGTAALLAFLFGPLGMLYSTIPGAIVMFFITAIAVVLTAGIGLLVTVPMCTIWAYMKVNGDNNRDINIQG